MAHTQPSDKVVEYSEESCIPAQSDIGDSVESEKRWNRENGNVKPVELLQEIVPTNWRKSLLVLQCP